MNSFSLLLILIGKSKVRRCRNNKTTETFPVHCDHVVQRVAFLLSVSSQVSCDVFCLLPKNVFVESRLCVRLTFILQTKLS